jgi:hypothetical protein
MKIKIDFITNSSSACFILRYVSALKPTDVKNKPSLVEMVRSSENKFINKRGKTKFEDYEDYVSIELFDGIDGVDFSYLPNEGKFDFNLYLTSYTTEENKEVNILNGDLRLSSILLNEDPENFYSDKIISILKDSFKNIEGDLEFSYSQFPFDVIGDGWDGGDPMGQYLTKYELFTNQDKVGKIIRTNGEWKLVLKEYV